MPLTIDDFSIGYFICLFCCCYCCCLNGSSRQFNKYDTCTHLLVVSCNRATCDSCNHCHTNSMLQVGLFKWLTHTRIYTQPYRSWGLVWRASLCCCTLPSADCVPGNRLHQRLPIFFVYSATKFTATKYCRAWKLPNCHLLVAYSMFLLHVFAIRVCYCFNFSVFYHYFCCCCCLCVTAGMRRVSCN